MGFFTNALKKALKKQIKQSFGSSNSQVKNTPKQEPLAAREIVEKQEEQPQVKITFHEEEYNKALQLYDEAQADKKYQKSLTRYFDLVTQIRETYSVINNVGSFFDDAGDALIEKCVEAMNIELEIKEKREYYENHIFDMSPPCKTLAMIYEKRGEYQRAATICVYAIENGYTADGTNGGMRGRLSRMIKKGNLPLTENIKKVLNL